MIPRLAASLLLAVLACNCGDDPAVATTTPLRLDITVSPNPLAAPAGPGDILWDVVLRASGRGTFLIERGEVLLLDASGAVVGQKQEFWSRSAGCSVCSSDFTILGGRSAQFSGKTVRYIGGGVPTRFIYTIFYSDSFGPGQTGVEVPVR
jgi:hypothetical protein